MLSEFLANHSSIQGALPALIDAALKGAILVFIAAAAAYLLRNRSAASRHAAWTAAVIGHLAIPALVLILPAWKMPILPEASWLRAAVETPAAPTAINAEGARAQIDANKAAPVSPTVQQPVNRATSDLLRQTSALPPQSGGPAPADSGLGVPLVAAVWFAGVLLVLLRLAFGTWRVGQLAREGARVEDGVWLSLTQRLANKLGVTRPLILLRGDRLAVPVTWGVVYPAVLLPQDADSWSEERRRFVLVHEMAHVKRFDALTQLLAQISIAVFWFDPLVWLAAHRMRVEREHACDDYVLRDGTTPSLYAGELLEMVRSIGTPSRESAAPAFAALAMARRSEFEGRMLAILDPRLDRHTLTRRGTLMTAVIVALLTLPLAALRPFQQQDTTRVASKPVAATPSAPAISVLPESFKVSVSDASSPPRHLSAPPALSPAKTVSPPQQKPSPTKWSCNAYPVGTVLNGTSTHINSTKTGSKQRLDFLVNQPGRCTEATVVGNAEFSPDETRIAQIAPGGLAWFRERTTAADRTVSAVAVGDGSLRYTASLNGSNVPFDTAVQSWLSRILPEVLREAGINVPGRVARLRAQGGVPAVLQQIGQIHSSSSKAMHYEELIKKGPMLTAGDLEKITQQVGRDLTSSGDLSAVLQMLPRGALQTPGARKALSASLSQIKSSGDKANTLEVLAPNADPEMLLVLARAAEDLPSSGDKANFLIATAAEYLTPKNDALTNAFFKTASTLGSSGDMANVLISAIPYGHSSPSLALQVVETSRGLRASGDAANVLIALVSQRLLKPEAPSATLAAIQRTLTMDSSGDRANVLIEIADADLLSTPALRNAFTQAAMALPSDGDRTNVLTAAARK
jgi:beta-lactamase regulating signal transducer with metallopeptidase domain